VKLGVTGVAEELTRIARRPVEEVSSETDAVASEADLYVGTEAVLHRVDKADVVVFLDFDQELLAPRYRAAEQAMSLLVQASRMVGRREDGGRILIQTRMPEHPVLEAARTADPGPLARAELGMRRDLQQPPEAHWAIVSGPAAAEFVRRLGNQRGLEILGPSNDRWRIRSDDREQMVAILKSVDRPPGRLRIEINPLRA
jgi:primosomal protein N' (replication factor Y)